MSRRIRQPKKNGIASRAAVPEKNLAGAKNRRVGRVVDDAQTVDVENRRCEGIGWRSRKKLDRIDRGKVADGYRRWGAIVRERCGIVRRRSGTPIGISIPVAIGCPRPGAVDRDRRCCTQADASNQRDTAEDARASRNRARPIARPHPPSISKTQPHNFTPPAPSMPAALPQGSR